MSDLLITLSRKNYTNKKLYFWFFKDWSEHRATCTVTGYPYFYLIFCTGVAIGGKWMTTVGVKGDQGSDSP